MEKSCLFSATKLSISFLLLTLGSGCASKLLVTYDSDPPGASIYEGGRRIGMAPVVLSYDITDEARRAGIMTLNPVAARWVSGATCTTSEITADMNKYGRKQSLTLVRPADVPNVQADADYAVGMQQNALIREQMDNAERASAISAMNNANQQLKQLKK